MSDLGSGVGVKFNVMVSALSFWWVTTESITMWVGWIHALMPDLDHVWEKGHIAKNWWYMLETTDLHSLSWDTFKSRLGYYSVDQANPCFETRFRPWGGEGACCQKLMVHARDHWPPFLELGYLEVTLRLLVWILMTGSPSLATKPPIVPIKGLLLGLRSIMWPKAVAVSVSTAWWKGESGNLTQGWIILQGNYPLCFVTDSGGLQSQFRLSSQSLSGDSEAAAGANTNRVVQLPWRLT